jgi:23S rRNA pseudouridine955/2504/2580 synthase
MSNPKQNKGVRLIRVDADRAGQRLDNFLANLLKGVPRAAVYRMIRTGQVRVNGGRRKPGTRLDAGDEVRVPPARIRDGQAVEVSEEVRAQLRGAILFEDRDLLVIDKPAGIAVHSGSGLPWGLIEALRQDRPGEYLELAHRLDRETSGCLVIARNGQALAELSTQFREGRAQKHYLCLLDGRLPEPLVEVDAPLARTKGTVEVDDEGKASKTRFRLLEAYEDSSYVEAELLTGRTHQIRAHARHIGLPLAGDSRYASRESVRKWKERGLKRIFLHAHHLVLAIADGAHHEFTAPLPEPLRQVLDQLAST